MAAIIRGTTPTISFVFKHIDPEDIDRAVLTIKQNGTTVVERMQDTMATDTDNAKVFWILTQEETLSLMPKRKVETICDWVLTDGTRGRSLKAEFGTEEPGKNEVISLG